MLFVCCIDFTLILELKLFFAASQKSNFSLVGAKTVPCVVSMGRQS